jgi:hypothetical protein
MTITTTIIIIIVIFIITIRDWIDLFCPEPKTRWSNLKWRDLDIDYRILLIWILMWECGLDFTGLGYDQWRVLVNTVMKFWVPNETGNFLTRWATNGLPRLLYGVNLLIVASAFFWSPCFILYLNFLLFLISFNLAYLKLLSIVINLFVYKPTIMDKRLC